MTAPQEAAGPSAPFVSVIVPSKDGERKGNVMNLLGDIAKQSYQTVEVILVIGAYPNGHARNVGAKYAKGGYLLMLDDDLRLGDEYVIEQLIKTFTVLTSCGMAGCSQQLPPDANKFQQISAKQLPRSEFPIVEEYIETDMVNHCAGFAIPSKLYQDISGEDDFILRGTDPDLRYRVEKAGYKIVVVPHTKSYHPLPDNWKEFWCYHWKCGFETGSVFRTHREKIVDVTYDGSPVSVWHRPLWWRGVRFLGRMIGACLKGYWLFVVAYISHILGFSWGVCFPRRTSTIDGTVKIYNKLELVDLINGGSSLYVKS